MYIVGDVIKAPDGAQYEVVKVSATKYTLIQVAPGPITRDKSDVDNDYTKVGP